MTQVGRVFYPARIYPVSCREYRRSRSSDGNLDAMFSAPGAAEGGIYLERSFAKSWAVGLPTNAIDDGEADLGPPGSCLPADWFVDSAGQITKSLT